MHGDVTHDDVLEDGLIVQSNSKVDMELSPTVCASRSSAMKAQTLSLRRKNLHRVGRLTNYYATVPAPPTIGELFKQAQEKYDIELPLIDLFKWGTNEDDINKIKTAIDAGPTTVEDVTCEQYVFHQEGVDWQIGIQLGDYPLPRRPAHHHPQRRGQAAAHHHSYLEPRASFNDAAFVFDPPPDAKRILFEGGKPPNHH